MKNLIEILIMLGFLLIGLAAKSQNITQTIRGTVIDKENLHSLYYDNDTQQIEKYTQTGMFPIFNYRVEF